MKNLRFSGIKKYIHLYARMYRIKILDKVLETNVETAIKQYRKVNACTNWMWQLTLKIDLTSNNGFTDLDER